MSHDLRKMEHLNYPKEYLNLHFTLSCGQAFRWRHDREGFWSAPVRGKVIRIKEAEEGFLWETLPGEPDFQLLSSYFRLDDDVPGIYEALSRADDHLSQVIDRFRGLRILRQEPEETILSYVCSTANSVPRIMRAVEEMSHKYGEFISEAGGRTHYAFPAVEAFASAIPDELAALGGLSWRGGNIAMVANQVLTRLTGWLESLRSLPYRDAKAELMSIRGIGAKIADCVLLFSLEKDEAVPVDTHIRQVVARYYMPDLKTKTITTTAYNRISQVFWRKFGHYAGWAQEFLFYEDFLRKRKQEDR